MTLRLMQLRFATAALLATVAVFSASSVAVSPAHAFTMESLSTNGGNTTRFADPDERVKNFESQGARPFGQNGPIVQFNAGQSSPRSSFRGYQPPPSVTGGGNN
jgi:hypothetical protein